MKNTQLQNSLELLSRSLAPTGVYLNDVDHNIHVEVLHDTDEIFGVREPEEKHKKTDACLQYCGADCQNPSCDNYLPF